MCGWETDIVARNIKGALRIDCRHDQGFERSHQVKSGHSLPEGVFPNRQVCIRYLDFSIYCDLGEQSNIWEVYAYPFEIGYGRLVQTNLLLYKMDSAVVNSILVVFEEEYR